MKVKINDADIETGEPISIEVACGGQQSLHFSFHAGGLVIELQDRYGDPVGLIDRSFDEIVGEAVDNALETDREVNDFENDVWRRAAEEAQEDADDDDHASCS